MPCSCIAPLFASVGTAGLEVQLALHGLSLRVDKSSSALHQRRSRRNTNSWRCEADADGYGGASSTGTRLGSTIKRKQNIIQVKLEALEAGELEVRMGSVKPLVRRSQLVGLIAENTVVGKTTIIAEIARLSPSESPEKLAQRCRDYVSWGVDVLAVCTDEEDSPQGIVDLAAACAGTGVPIVRKDWILHPIQIAESVEAGAAAIHVVHSVLGKGTLPICKFAVSYGLDVIVEVVNKKEALEMEAIGLPVYGINLSVALSLPIPGLRQSIAKSLIKDLPFGAASVVGVASIEEAQQMKSAGADAVYFKMDALQRTPGIDTQKLLQNLAYLMSGDD